MVSRKLSCLCKEKSEAAKIFTNFSIELLNLQFFHVSTVKAGISTSKKNCFILLKSSKIDEKRSLFYLKSSSRSQNI